MSKNIYKEVFEVLTESAKPSVKTEAKIDTKPFAVEVNKHLLSLGYRANISELPIDKLGVVIKRQPKSISDKFIAGLYKWFDVEIHAGCSDDGHYIDVLIDGKFEYLVGGKNGFSQLWKSENGGKSWKLSR